MKKRFPIATAIAAACLTVSISIEAQCGNTGIGTTSPTTKLDVDGALTTCESSATLSVGAGPVTINNLTH